VSECRAFEPRIRALERAAEQLKRRYLAQNAAILNRVRPFPGSELVEPLERPDSGNPDWFSNPRGPMGAAFRDYVYATRTEAQFDALVAADWSTDRSYVAPRGIKAVKIRDFFVSQLTPDWRPTRESRSPGIGPPSLRTRGIGVYQLTFRRDGHCLGLDVGVVERRYECAGRGIDIGTDRPLRLHGRTVC